MFGSKETPKPGVRSALDILEEKMLEPESLESLLKERDATIVAVRSDLGFFEMAVDSLSTDITERQLARVSDGLDKAKVRFNDALENLTYLQGEINKQRKD